MHTSFNKRTHIHTLQIHSPQQDHKPGRNTHRTQPHPDRTLIDILLSGRIIHPSSMHTQTPHKHMLHVRAQNQMHTTPNALGLKHAPHTPTHTRPHTEHTHRLPHPRARTHAYMHTCIHTQPAPAFSLGGREGGAEWRRGRKEGGWAGARRGGHRCSFPFDLGCCPSDPHFQAKGVSCVQVGSSGNPGKREGPGNQPAGARTPRGP
jgi:hypothetical protein